VDGPAAAGAPVGMALGVTAPIPGSLVHAPRGAGGRCAAPQQSSRPADTGRVSFVVSSSALVPPQPHHVAPDNDVPFGREDLLGHAEMSHIGQVAEHERNIQPAAVLLVDDEPAVLAAVARLLHPAGVRVFTAGDGADALAVLDEQASAIGVVVSDYAMPSMSGAELLRTVRLRWPDITRVLLTGNADLPAAAAAVNEGQVARLFLKPWDPPAFQRAVLQVLDEHRLVHENRRLHALLDRAATALREIQPEMATNVRPHVAGHSSGKRTQLAEPLSPRELEVLPLLAQGQTNREIGRALYVSAATVKVHVGHILAKLEVTDRTQAAVRAVALGLVVPPPA